MIPLKQTVTPLTFVNLLYRKLFALIIFICLTLSAALNSKAFAELPSADLSSAVDLTASITQNQDDNQNTVFPSTPTLILQDRNNKTISLDNYLEKRQSKITPEIPSTRESLNSNSER